MSHTRSKMTVERSLYASRFPASDRLKFGQHFIEAMAQIGQHMVGIAGEAMFGMDCRGGPPTSTASGRIRWSRVAEDKTSSQSGSGAVLFGIVHPEMMALCVGIGGVRAAHALHLVQQGKVGQSGPAQFSPITPPTA